MSKKIFYNSWQGTLFVNVFDSSNILGNIIQPQDYAELTESEIEQIYLNPETTPQELEAIEQLLKERAGK